MEAFLELLPRTTAQAAALAEEHEERVAGRAWTTTDADRPLRHALEVRSDTFDDPSFTRALSRAGAVLARWADVAREEAAGGRDVLVLFDDDVGGHAPRDALALARLLDDGDRLPAAGGG